MKLSLSLRLLAGSALMLGLAACTGGASTGAAEVRTTTRPEGASLLQQVRSAGQVGDELDVQPLRDPRVEDLRADATTAEARSDFAGAARLLEQAAQYAPEDPDLLQWQAELALASRDWSRAETLATQSWEKGPKLGGLCRRNWTTLRIAAEQRGDAAAAALAGERVAGCTVAPPVRL